jgi:tripartite-type tricarboxylate transporter receptor subunit TctC
MITLHSFRDFSRIGMSLLSLCTAANALEAAAQPFPSKIIRIVVPTGSSTPPDIISRVIAAELSESEGWRVVVENRPSLPACR